MSDLEKPFDFSEIVGYPNDIPEDVLDNVLNFQYGDDACAHVKAFEKLIDDWDNSPICEDALMRLFSSTLLVDDGYAGHWFLLYEDIRSRPYGTFCMTFWKDLGIIYNELVDDFMEKWRKNLLAIKTTISDVEIDSPPDPIEELKDIILNMQYAHTKQCEAMNEQFMAIEDQIEILEANFIDTYGEYLDPHKIELDSEKDKEVHRENQMNPYSADSYQRTGTHGEMISSDLHGDEDPIRWLLG
jgi:hypothetical protein